MARDRRTEILDVAREVFLEQGYAATSMSAIAARLGGSKSTLYSYFEGKEQLFRAHIERECAISRERMFAGHSAEGDLRHLLLDLGTRYLAVLSSEQALCTTRAVIAQAVRAPEVGEMLYAAGPRAMIEWLGGFFEQASAEGRLAPCDPMVAAHQFLGLCQAQTWKRRLFNVGPPPETEEIAQDVGAAVDTFLRAFAPRAG